MAKIIEARVIQKIDTEQNWNANELILYKGEIALVGDPGRVYNIKVGNGVKKFRDLPYMVDYINGLYTGVITPQSQVPSGINNVFLVSEQGTYTNFGGVVLPKDNLGIIYKNGNNFTIQLIPIVSEEKLQKYIDEKLVDINVGFGGEITSLNQFPTIEGMYLPKLSGVYPNFGNLEYNPIEGFTLFLYKDGQFSKVVVPLNAVEEDVNFNNNTLGVSGSAVEKYAVKKINTIAELRNSVGEYEGQIVGLLGYYEAGDKETLDYKWINTQGVDDSGSVINSENGSWLAVFGDNIKVEDFGAKGDVESNGIGTDDTSSFLAALNYINSKKGGVLKLSNKKYLVTDTLPLYNYTYIIGSNGGAQEYLGVLNNPTTIVYKGVNTLFKNLSIDDGDYHSTIFFGGLQKLNILTYTDVILYDLSSIQFSNNTDVTISGINRVGHAISGYSDGSFNNFVNCCFEKLNIGLKPKLKIGYPFDDNNFVNCRWHDNNIGVELNYESDSNKFIGCSFAYNNIDIILDNARNNYFQNIRIENRINKSVRLLNGARNNSLFMTAMINLSTVTSDFKLFIDEGVDNIVHLLPDSTHYSLHSDFYPENSNSGYTSSVPCNLVSDCYSINDKSIEIGSLVSESYEPGYFKKDRIKRIINTNTLTYYKINIDKKVLKTLNPNDELVAGIWIKTDNSNYSDLNQLLRVVQLLNDNSDVEIVSHYVHPNDNDWHLCKVSFRINSNYNKNSTVALYLRLFLKPNVNILISKPMLYHGNTLYNNMMNDYKNNGESIKRPNLTTDDKGIVFFDVDINKPIWWNGTTWVDSSGTSV